MARMTYLNFERVCFGQQVQSELLNTLKFATPTDQHFAESWDFSIKQYLFSRDFQNISGILIVHQS